MQVAMGCLMFRLMVNGNVKGAHRKMQRMLKSVIVHCVDLVEELLRELQTTGGPMLVVLWQCLKSSSQM